MDGEPIHVSESAFERAVVQARVPVVVDFWAPWCGPCRQIAPMLEKLAKEFDGRLVVAKVNSDEEPALAERYGVQGIPTLVFMARGKEVHRQVGLMPEPILRDSVEELLGVVEGTAD